MERRPFPVLLSQVLVAFTIEFDNEVERNVPHRTTIARRRENSAPYLLSLAMWAHFLQFVDDDGTSIGALLARTRLSRERFTQWLRRMSEWWGYVVVDRDATVARSQWIVRPTPAGQHARAVWAATFDVLERRWATRFGEREIATLRDGLRSLARVLGGDLPAYLPIVGYGLATTLPEGARVENLHHHDDMETRPLITLISNVLHAFALEFERASELALAICANALRAIGARDVKVSELPLLAGVSVEAIAMSVSFLESRGYAEIASHASGRKAKHIRLTAKGCDALDRYERIAADIERRWGERFGKPLIDTLCATLRRFFETTEDGRPTIVIGLHPDSTGWRGHKRYLARSEAYLEDPAGALPWFPMVLHRGGWPDGS